jgi:hypothetical protein
MPERVAEVSQIFFRDDHVLTKLLSYSYSYIPHIAEVTGGKPIAIQSQSISGVSAINPLVTFYGIHRRKREVIFFRYAPDTTRD